MENLPVNKSQQEKLLKDLEETKEQVERVDDLEFELDELKQKMK